MVTLLFLHNFCYIALLDLCRLLFYLYTPLRFHFSVFLLFLLFFFIFFFPLNIAGMGEDGSFIGKYRRDRNPEQSSAFATLV